MAHRPQKKKKRNPTLPEESDVDERSFVDTGESADLSLEDRFQIYWQENRGFIIGCIVLLVLFVGGYQGLSVYQDHRETQLQKAYANADSPEALNAFAKKRADTEIGAFASLRSADAAFEAGAFQKAERRYARAANALADTPMAGRAQLGQAFAIHEAGDREAGLEKLRSLLNNPEIPNGIRAEAAYHLALHAQAEGESDTFEQLRSRLENMEDGAQWAQAVSRYQ